VAQVVCSDGFAGVERYVLSLSTGLVAQGCSVVVIGGDPKRMYADLEHRVEAWYKATTVTDAIRQLVRAGRFDIVHSHMTAAEVAVCATRIIGRGRFFTTRHFASRRGKTAWGKIASRGIERMVDQQLAISDFVAARVDGHSVVIKPGVPCDYEARSADRHPIALVAQRLEAEKQTEVALQAWARSGLAGRGWVLHIAGAGAEEAKLRTLAEDLGITEACKFLGPRADMTRHYREASMLLATRPDEPFGLVVVEAMAAALPVVAAAGGGHLETVGACPEAKLYAPGNADEAAAQMLELADDEGTRTAYGARLQAVQRERFDVDRQIKQTLAAYLA